MVFDSDDFGCSHQISPQCMSYDCRDMLFSFKATNPKFKATLFAIPGEMTAELTAWCQLNQDWIELAVHGLFHQTNYECAEMSYDDFDFFMGEFKDMFDTCFVKGFKAPGWQISDGIYKWLKGHNYWVADQGYNDKRRPLDLSAYINNDGKFSAHKIISIGKEGKDVIKFEKSGTLDAIHTHTWNCVGNGVYELQDEINKKIKDVKEFKFISEVLA